MAPKRPARGKDINDGNRKRPRKDAMGEEYLEGDETLPTLDYIKKLEVVRRPAAFGNQHLHRRTRQDFQRLVADLKGYHNTRKTQGNLASYHVAWYDRERLEADLAAKINAHESLMNAGEDPNSVAAKASKKQMDDVKSLLTKATRAHKAGKFDNEDRKRQHDWETMAQAEIEDFLYYQDPLRRWARRSVLNPNTREVEQAKLKSRRISYKLIAETPDENYSLDWLHDILDFFDERDIGGVAYKRGLRDCMGNYIEREPGVPPEPPLIGPRELHLWTPTYRRPTVGLPTRINLDTATGKGRTGWDGREMFEYDPGNNGSDFRRLQVRLDEEAIEKHRAKHEKAKLTDHEGNPLNYNTHTERRLQEMERYSGTMPNTASVLVMETKKGRETQARWGELHTKSGLFIAAKETSWDWLTSYDCLGKVKGGWYPRLSAIRDEPPSDNDGEDGDDTPPPDTILDSDEYILRPDYARRLDQDHEKLPKGDELNELEPVVAPKAPTKKAKKDGKRKLLPEDEEKEQGDVSVKKSYLKRRANLDYPYLKREFDQKPKELQSYDDEKDHLETDQWAEETDGRREWHVHQQLAPSSPVDSPPHIPIDPSGPSTVTLPHVSDAPDVWNLVPDNAIDELELDKRRCDHNGERCRAWWWHHLGKECWIAESQKTQRPERPPGSDADDLVKAWEEKLMDINEPHTMIIPSSNVETYRRRILDHYGVMPGADSRWPKRGIRIPYEPFTYHDRRLDPECPPSESGEGDDTVTNPEKTFIAKDARKRAVHSFRTLEVPIIETPQRTWDVVGEDPAPPLEVPIVETPQRESEIVGGGPALPVKNNADGLAMSGIDKHDKEPEDEGDHFHMSYRKYSILGGRPSASAGSEGPPDPGGVIKAT